MNLRCLKWPLMFVIVPAWGCVGEPAPPSWVGSPAIRGFNIACWSPGCLESPAAERTLDRAVALGATHLALVPRWFVADATSGVPAADDGRAPSFDELEAFGRRVRGRGLAVLLKPHVNRLDGGSRTEIAPARLDPWWAAYRGYLLQVADLGARLDAQALAVGTELTRVSCHDQRWRALLDDVRRRFDGELTYAANWDELEGVAFLDALDWVGVDGYFPGATSAGEALIDRVHGWQHHLWRLSRLDAIRRSRLVFTELGATAADPADQAQVYRAALTALAKAGGAFSRGGVFFWNLWEGEHGGTHVATPAAQQQLAAAWR